jgi:hypothetical protein
LARRLEEWKPVAFRGVWGPLWALRKCWKRMPPSLEVWNALGPHAAVAISCPHQQLNNFTVLNESQLAVP